MNHHIKSNRIVCMKTYNSPEFAITIAGGRRFSPAMGPITMSPGFSLSPSPPYELCALAPAFPLSLHHCTLSWCG